MKQLLLAGIAAGLLVGPIGCRHCRRQPSDTASLPPPPGGFLGPPVAPPPGVGGDRIPPPALPTTPGFDGGGSLPPPVVPDSRGSLRVDPAFPPAASLPPTAALPPLPSAPATPAPAPYRSAKPPKELFLPDGPADSGKVIAPPDYPSASGYLGEPVRPNDSAKPSGPPSAVGSGDLPPAPMTPNRSLPPSSPSAPAPTAVPDRPPVGLSGYTAVPDKPGVFAGRRPDLDGFDALKAAGIRTVVYIHDPSTDVGPARELAEKRGLKFVPVPASPEALARAASAFNAAVADAAGRPAYVCDEDGLRAGFLWYLHFRTVDYMNDDTARVRATGLGLRDDGTEATKRYWLAAQEYLANHR